MDLNMADLAQIVQDPLGDLFRPENIKGSDDGSGGNYAKAFHTEGPDLCDQTLDLVRKEVERCNCLQGVQFVHSISGGTGSGLTGLLQSALWDYLDKSSDGLSKCIMQNFTLVPSPDMPASPVEPYNATLAFKDLIDYSDQCFLFDNKALTDICRKALKVEVPRQKQLNNIVAQCMSGITSCLRYTGPLNADLRKMHVNLVPFGAAGVPRIKFMMSSFAPLTDAKSGEYRKISPLDLVQQMLSKDNVTCSVDPLFPGGKGPDGHDFPKARFLASWAAWRGSFQTHEIDRITYEIWKKGSRYDQFFPDWVPNPIANNICAAKSCESGSNSIVFASNSTCIAEIFDRLLHQFNKLFPKRAYIHTFESEGIDAEEIQGASFELQNVKDEYFEKTRCADEILPADHSDATGEEQKIAEELMELGMWKETRQVMLIEDDAKGKRRG
jgi:tubulin beta